MASQSTQQLCHLRERFALGSRSSPDCFAENGEMYTDGMALCTEKSDRGRILLAMPAAIYFLGHNANNAQMRCCLHLSLSHENALSSSFEHGYLCDSGLDPNAGAKSTGLAIGRRQVAGGREGSNFMLPHHKPTRRYGRDDGFADRCPCVSSTPPPALPVLISCVVLCDLREPQGKVNN